METVYRCDPPQIFIFDSDLICRYAAPAGDTFLGRRREELVGRHAAEILPPTSKRLRPVLERALREQASWSTRRYRYRHRQDDGERLYVWAIVVAPVVQASGQGVLVSLMDTLEPARQRHRLRRENEALRARIAHLVALHRRRLQERLDLEARLRTALTPVWGYVQLLLRRPELLRDPAVAGMLRSGVVPPLRSAVESVTPSDEWPDAGQGRP